VKNLKPFGKIISEKKQEEKVKKVSLYFLLFAALSCGLVLAQDIPVFEEEILLEYTNGNMIYPLIDATYFSIADLVDWNNDGAFDIILGSFMNGQVDVYPNSGTNANPAFVEEDAEPMLAGGVPIYLSSG
jgi:hypothetical protein